VIVDATANLLHGYRGLPIVTTPDAVLVNGVGQTNCKHSQTGVPCYQNNPAEIKAVAGSKVRLRLINTGSHAMVRFSLDNHVLTVVEVDDTPIQPVQVHEVPINVGQRYSVVVDLNQGARQDRPSGSALTLPLSASTPSRLSSAVQSSGTQMRAATVLPVVHRPPHRGVTLRLSTWPTVSTLTKRSASCLSFPRTRLPLQPLP
jgi:FtsP/CotA-like multicopper oxidase with cupredoxin domain